MRALSVMVLLATSGCGFERAGLGDDQQLFETGVLEDTGSSPEDTFVEVRDSGDSAVTMLDATPETPTCDESACGTLPPTAKRVALVERSVACPPGFKTTDVVEGTDGNACSCSCTLNAAPACPANGAIPTYYGSGTGCGTTGAVLTSVAANSCTGLGFSGSLANYFKATAPGPVGGACGPMPVTDVAAVTRPRRLCEPDVGSCEGAICAPPFVECIETSGACPSAFPVPRVVGTSANVNGCPACTCTMSATCSGTISFFGTSTCGDTAVTLPVDGTCAAVPSSPGAVTHFKYAPKPPAAASCTASFATAPGTRTLVARRTLCCK